MKNITLENAFVTVSLLGVLGYAGSVAAHNIDGALGKAAGAIDYYRVVCSANSAGSTDHLFVEIMDLAPVAAPLISVQVTKDLIARNTTDAVDGNATYSPTLIVKGGNGEYRLTVDKTAVKAETYNLQVHCETSNGQHTDTTEPYRIQDQ